MKKTISLALAGVLALGLLTGCRDTPDTPAVIVKDQEQMLETAEKAGKTPPCSHPWRFPTALPANGRA